MEEHKNNQELSFIKEKIKDKPINKRRLLRKTLWIILSGILFGLISCLTFVVAKPKFEKLVEPHPDSMVTFPKDQEPDTQEPEEPENQTPENPDSQEPGDTTPEDPTDQEPTDQEPGDQDPGEQVPPEPIIVEKELEVADYQSLQYKLYAIGKKGNRSVVTVTGVTSNTDWFNSAYESESQGCGIIIANNGQELLILSEKRIIDDAQEIRITFPNDVVVPAVLKKYDGNTGIAIISVALGNISEETMEKIDVAVLGNSLTVNQGTLVWAIGSPMGVNYEIRCGTITSSNNLSTWDSDYTVFTTDIAGSSKGSGVLINLNGEVVGIVLQEYSSSGYQKNITALSVSKLKTIIENLLNGQDIPYLGLKLSTVTEEISTEFELPKGVYIKGVETDWSSPSMNAGLQEGDVIVSIDGEEIMTVDAYTQKLMSLKPEQQVNIHVLRLSGEEYVELECVAVVGILQ